MGRHRRARGQRHPPSRERNDRRRGLVVAPGRTVAVVRRLPRTCKVSDTEDNGHRRSFAPAPLRVSSRREQPHLCWRADNCALLTDAERDRAARLLRERYANDALTLAELDAQL